MPRYFINGKTYNIPDDKAEDFLSKNQDATEIEPIADWKTDTDKYAQQVKKRVEAGYADATGEMEQQVNQHVDQFRSQLDNTQAAQTIEQANDLSGVGLSNPNQGAFGQTSQYFNPLPRTGRELNMPSYESENYEVELDDILKNDLDYDEQGVKNVKWALGVMKETALTTGQKENVVTKSDEMFPVNTESGEISLTNFNPEGLRDDAYYDEKAKGDDWEPIADDVFEVIDDVKDAGRKFLNFIGIGEGKQVALDSKSQDKIDTQQKFLKEAKENLDAQVKNGSIKEYNQQDVISTAKYLYSKDLTTTANSENIDEYIKNNFNTKEVTRDGKKIEIEKSVLDTARSEMQLKLDKITDLYVEKTSTYGEKLIANTNGVMVRLEELNKAGEVLISNAKKNPPKTAEELDVLYNELEKINKEKNQQIAVGERNTAKLDYLAIDEEKLGRFGDLIGRNYNGIAKFAGLASSSAINMGLGIEEYANSVALNLTPARLFENIVLPATKWVGDDAQAQKAMQINQALKMLPPTPVGIPGVPLSAIQSKAYQDYRKTVVDSVDKFSENISANVAKPMNYSDIKSAGDWGQWALDFSAQQGPQIGLMIAAPQIALPLLSMSSGGSKIRDMRKEMSQGLADYSEAQIMAAGTLTGIGEYVSERLTLGQLKRLRLKNINVNVAKNGFRSRLSSTLFNPNRIKATIYDVNEEGVGEMFAKFTENLADKYIGGKKDVGIWDGMEEAYVGGVFMSGVLFRAPSIASQIMAPFKTKSLNLKFEENANNINKLANELNKGVNPETRTIIENKISSLVGANAQLRVDQAMSTDYLSQDQKNNLINIHKQTNTNNIEIEALKNDKSIKPEVKEGLITSIQIENARLQKGQEAIMDPAIQAHYNQTYKNVEGIVSKMEGVTIKEMTTEEIKAENIKRGQSNDKKASLIESGKETAQELINENNPGTFNKLTGEIIINKEAALANKQVNVAAHELLHGVMNQTFKNNPAAQKEFGKGVLAELSKIKGIEGTKLLSRIDQYQRAADAGKMSQEDAYEEAMNLLGDAIATKDVKIPETVLSKIGKFITDTVGKAFPSWKTKFSKGSDVVSFIQNFQQEVGEGELSAETLTVAEKGAKGKLAKVKPTKAKTKTKKTKPSLPKELVGVEKIRLKMQENWDDVLKIGKEKWKTDEILENQIKRVEKLEIEFDAAELRKELQLIDELHADFHPTVESESRKEDLELALEEKFAPLADAVKTAGMDIKTGTITKPSLPTIKGVTPTNVKDMIGKVANRAVAKYYRGIPRNIREKAGLDRATYLDSAKTELTQIAQKYDPTKKDKDGNQVSFDRYMANTGMQRLNALATKLGVESSEQGVTQSLDSPQAQQVADTTTETETEVADNQRKLNPEAVLPKDKATDQFLEDTKTELSKLSTPELSNIRYSTSQSVAQDAFAKIFNVPVNKIFNKADNFKKGEAAPLQRFILKNAPKLIRLLPQGNAPVRQVKAKTGDKTIKRGGEGVALPRKLQDTFYAQLKTPEGKPKKVDSERGKQSIQYRKRPDITQTQFLETFGIKNGKVDPNFTPRSGEAQAIKGIMEIAARNVTNLAARQEIDARNLTATEAATAKQKIGEGKSNLMFNLAETINTPEFKKIKKALNIKGDTVTEVVKNAMARAAQDTAFLGNNAKMVKELLRIATAEVKPLVLEAKIIYAGLQLQKQLGKNKFRMVNKGIQTDNQKTDWQSEINMGTPKNPNWQPFNLEVKSADAQLGSLTINELNFADGAYKVKNNISDVGAIDSLLKELDTKAFQELAAAVGVDISDLSNTMTPEQYEKIRDSVYKGELGLQLISNKDSNGLGGFTFKDVAEIYANKITPTYYMQVEGKGLVAIGKDIYNLGVPSMENQSVNFYVRPVPQSIKRKGKPKRIKIIMRITPHANAKTWEGIKKSELDITKQSDLKKVVNSVKKGMKYSLAEQKIDNTLQKGKDALAKNPNLKPSLPDPVKLDTEINTMIQDTKGIEAKKRFSDVVAKRRGASVRNFRLISPGAQDFNGLMYDLYAKGKKGEAQQKWVKENLTKPYQEGIAKIDKYRQALKNDYATLLKQSPNVAKKLGKIVPGTEFTYDQALRVNLWTQGGFEVPGLSKRDAKKLNNIVEKDAELLQFNKAALLISKQDSWIEPSPYWDTESLISDLNNLTTKVGRKKFLAEFITNSGVVFSKENLNKMEVALGTNWREAMEDSLYRMRNGTNRPAGTNKLTNNFLNWVNNSVGAIMFFNMKSALLQTISSINFINWSDNNPFKAAVAFGNQPQFWSDFTTLWNSPKLKQRRSGLKKDVNEAELANAAQGSTNKASAALSYLLKLGFTPTQLADSFAIASGGATFYRNRINTYKKQGLNKKSAEEKAFADFAEASDVAQQSADPMLISQQQASPLGRLILAFQNTPAQVTRIFNKSARDFINNRGDQQTNVSKMIYYGAVQGFIFAALQNAAFALIPGFNEEDDEEKRAKDFDKKEERILNSMADTLLRGSGVYGAIVATLKNTALTYFREEKKDAFGRDHRNTLVEIMNLSPPVGSKLRKVNNAIKAKEYNEEVVQEQGWDVTLKGKVNLSPSYQVLASLTEAFTNLPLERAVIEIDRVVEMLDARNTTFQRVALALGYRTWDVGAKNGRKRFS